MSRVDFWKSVFGIRAEDIPCEVFCVGCKWYHEFKQSSMYARNLPSRHGFQDELNESRRLNFRRPLEFHTDFEVIDSKHSKDFEREVGESPKFKGFLVKNPDVPHNDIFFWAADAIYVIANILVQGADSYLVSHTCCKSWSIDTVKTFFLRITKEKSKPSEWICKMKAKTIQGAEILSRLITQGELIIEIDLERVSVPSVAKNIVNNSADPRYHTPPRQYDRPGVVNSYSPVSPTMHETDEIPTSLKKTDSWTDSARHMPSNSVGCGYDFPRSYSLNDPFPQKSRLEAKRSKPPGLVNLGNTCYMNAVLQCLVRVKPLVEAVKRYSGGSASGILGAFSSLAADLHSSQYAVDPGRFRKVFLSQRSVAEVFDDHQQHDAHEFMLFLVDQLDSASGESLMKNVLNGETQTSFTCGACGRVSNVKEKLCYLCLGIPRERVVKIDDCLNLYQREEHLSKENAMDCAKCKKGQPTVKVTKILCFGRILIISFQRFERDKYGRLIKNETGIQYSGVLNAERWTVNQRGEYRLMGVVFHSGSLEFGHYTAVARESDGDEWWSFNDGYVEQIEPQMALRSNAYLLFYESK
jgi:ubiquitin C-terminal hydrolase